MPAWQPSQPPQLMKDREDVVHAARSYRKDVKIAATLTQPRAAYTAANRSIAKHAARAIARLRKTQLTATWV
jgi:hypothetical protein